MLYCAKMAVYFSVIVYTLGNNAFGQCGRDVIPDEKYRASRLVHTIHSDDVIKVVCGHDHTLLLTNSGKVYSSGLGTDGQTGELISGFICYFSFFFIAYKYVSKTNY